MTTQRTIGFDLDDILLDFNGALRVFHNAKYDTTYEREHITTYDFCELWQCEPEEMIRRVLEFYASKEHQGAVPVEGSVEAIKKLSQYHKLIIITSKPDELRVATMQWLDQHFPHMFDEVHFTNHYVGNGRKRPKGEVCKQYGVEIFIDDALIHAESVANTGIPVLLFDTPWNQGELSPLITRVYSWEEIERRLSVSEI